MSNNRSDSIIIRQEVILPAYCAPPQQPVAAPCHPFEICADPIRPERAIHTIVSPQYDEVVTGSGIGGTFYTVRGHSESNTGLGARRVCIAITAQHQDPVGAPEDYPGYLCKGASGGYVPIDWQFPNVTIAPPYQRKWLLAWAWFDGDIYPCKQQHPFTPRATSSGSGYGPFPCMPEQLGSERVGPEPRRCCIDFGGSTRPVALQFDEYCSVESHGLWKGWDDSRATEWILKITRYGERLIASLLRRAAGDEDRLWLAVDFSWQVPTSLHLEGGNQRGSLPNPLVVRAL